MSVRFSARALADLRAIVDYIAERRPSGAVSVIRRIEATVA
jgi:plasmid stabilization system protein ParE